MNTHNALLAMGLLYMTASPAFAADAVAERLVAYQSEGASDFNAERGREMWLEEFSQPNGKRSRSCASCHTEDPVQKGKHVRTGKSIEPLAPSVNAERLTSGKDIEKWLKRNCKWTVGRACTAQEKGDILTYLRGL